MSLIKHQIEHAIKQNKRNAKSLKSLLNISEQLEAEGWSPDMYKELITELERVQMCVLHRSVITDLIDLLGLIDVNALPRISELDDYGYKTEPCFSDYERVQAALRQALNGCP